MIFRPGRLHVCAETIGVAAIFWLLCTPAVDGQVVTVPAVKATYLYNFAKFAEWPSLPASSPIAVCILGDEAVTAVFAATIQGQSIAGHTLDLRRPVNASAWHTCHVLFITDAETRRASEALTSLKTLPVLTVSDGPDFARSSGIIELYFEDGRMRFAINVDALERSGMRLSSRLLGLARIVRSRDVR